MNDNETEILLKCDCGCTILNLHRWEWKEYTDYSLSYYYSQWYNKQDNWWDILKERVGMAWSSLRGKRYLLEEISLSKEQFEEWKEKINKL